MLDDLAAVTPHPLDRAADALGPHRIHGAETQILKLQPDIVHPQPLGNGSVDFEGFAGNAAALVRLQHAQGAHVVQAVGQLYQNDPDILGHGQSHFLEVFRLLLGAGLKFNTGQLGHTIHQLRHGGAELIGEGFLGDGGIFNHIVQHGRHQALMVHVHVGENGGNRQGVGNVGLAAAAALPFVGLFSVVIGAPYQIHLLRRQVIGESVG